MTLRTEAGDIKGGFDAFYEGTALADRADFTGAGIFVHAVMAWLLLRFGALEQADEHRVDLVVTDVVMPHLGGIELARELRNRRPDLPVLFISGYTNSALAEEADSGDVPDLLQKPFAPRELRRRVRNALERSRRS